MNSHEVTRHELDAKGANSAHLVAIGKFFPSSCISLCFYIVGYLGQNGVYPMFIVVSIFIEIENKEENIFSCSYAPLRSLKMFITCSFIRQLQ
jgi:hypothetical protein